MTKQRFNGLRRELYRRIYEYGKANGCADYDFGNVMKAMPVPDFKKIAEHFGKETAGYADAWEMLKPAREPFGM